MKVKTSNLLNLYKNGTLKISFENLGGDWISPDGVIYNSKDNHGLQVIKKPEFFGLSKKELEGISGGRYDEFGKYSHLAIMNKWIRVRHYRNEFNFEVYILNRKTKDIIYDYIFNKKISPINLILIESETNTTYILNNYTLQDETDNPLL